MMSRAVHVIENPQKELSYLSCTQFSSTNDFWGSANSNFICKSPQLLKGILSLLLKMQHVRRAAWSNFVKSRNGLASSLNRGAAQCLSDLGLAEGSRNFATRTVSTLVKKQLGGANGSGSGLANRQWTRECSTFTCLPFQVAKNYDMRSLSPLVARTMSSSASGQEGEKASKTRKEVTTADDPFDAPTYNIPEKPVSFTEGASYTVVILAGLSVATAAAYGVFKELIFQPKEYKIFNMALKRIQNDSQVRAKIGSPMTGYGQETRNRAARQRIPNRIWTDEDGIEHIEVHFYVRGPHGSAQVKAEMFKDAEDRQWKYTSLMVEVLSPSRSILILESYLPSLKPA